MLLNMGKECLGSFSFISTQRHMRICRKVRKENSAKCTLWIIAFRKDLD